MKKLLAILAVALAIPTMGFALGEGRYQMMKIEGYAIWVLDTKTGFLRLCYKEDLTKPPACAPITDVSK